MSIAGKLIQIIKKHPILYDTTDIDYRNKDKNDALWLQIAKDLNEDDMELKKRWRNLRDTYVKLLRLVKNSEKDKVFSAAAIRKYHKWVWTKEMEFFRRYFPHETRLDLNNLTIEQIEEEDKKKTQKDLKSITRERSVRNSTLKRKSLKEKSPSSSPPRAHSPARTSKLRKIQKPLNTRSKTTISTLELDATDRLFLAHAQNIKQFSVRRQAMTKLKIAEVIMEQEILHQEDMELASISAVTAKSVINQRVDEEDSLMPFETVCGYVSDGDEDQNYVVAKSENFEENPMDENV